MGRQRPKKHIPKPPTPFSLKDEANSTHFHFTNDDLKLRANRVAFVSASLSSSDDLDKLTKRPCPSSVDEIIAQSVPAKHDAPLLLEMTNLNVTDENSVTADAVPRLGSVSDSVQMEFTKPSMSGDCFFIDTQGSTNDIQTGLPMPVMQRSASPATSVSSEEIILFSGRRNQYVSPKECPALPLQHRSVVSLPNPVTIDPTSGQPSHDGRSGRVRTHSPIEHGFTPAPHGTHGGRRSRQSTGISQSNSTPRQRKHAQKRRQYESERDSILADYIANIDGHVEISNLTRNPMLWGRQLDINDTDGWQDEIDDSEVQPGAESDTSYSVTWERADLAAFDDLSTSSEVLAEVKEILHKRERVSGTQYLIDFEGYTIDDARWMPAALLSSSIAQEKVRGFEMAQAQLVDDTTGRESDPDSGEEAQLTQDLEEDIGVKADERDVLERLNANMADKQTARLLFKQEEFGLDSNGLLLHDGIEQYSLLANRSGKTFGKAEIKSDRWSHGRGRKRPRHDFPDASLLADVLEQDPYDGFDIMDFDRPSLRRKVKGRRGKLPLELSDSDLEQEIQSQWEKDRNKKKVRREEREKLRAEGLLGKKGKLRYGSKYPAGIPLAEALNEIKLFLGSTDDNLVLPPMSDRDRRMVHEIANTFNAKSRSSGKGNNRFPVLYRTHRTIPYDENLLGRKLSRIFLGKSALRMEKMAQPKTTSLGVARRGGFSKAAVSYQDGDIVGASAPELGVDNKGRAMLEKMGWSTGTALGAMNNKGIMQPVVHVVKNSKAGLG